MAERLQRPDRAILNLHCPPRDTHLDQAALLDDNFRPVVKGGQIVMTGVGSTAVRDAIHHLRELSQLEPGYLVDPVNAADVGFAHESTALPTYGRLYLQNRGRPANT